LNDDWNDVLKVNKKNWSKYHYPILINFH